MNDFPFQFQPDKVGINAVLGELECEIMECVWVRGPLTVRELHAIMAERRTIAYTTVMTVMSRLAEKGILRREKEGIAFRYHPALNRTSFQESLLRKIMRSLIGSFGKPAISQFVETLGDERPEEMARLAHLIEKKRKEIDE